VTLGIQFRLLQNFEPSDGMAEPQRGCILHLTPTGL
jgi:hypothetical protein